MKTTMLSLLITLMTFANMNAQSIDRLWKSYDEAIKNDRPKTAMTVLEQVKSSALEQRLAWDYYLACSRYVECGTGINWKDAERMKEQMEKEFEEYDEPVLLFYHRSRENTQGLTHYIEEHKEVLKAGMHADFHRNDYSYTGFIFSEALLNIVKNDYEYALWSLVRDREHEAAETLAALYGDEYPKSALLEFYGTDSYSENAMREYAAKYKGKAVSFLARQNLLQMKFNKLNRKTEKSQEDYIRLRKECGEFISGKAGFSGVERTIAGCATLVEELAAQLDEKMFSFSIDRSVMEVSFQNLDKVNYVINKGKDKVASGTVKNSKCSYYLMDKEEMRLNNLDDGDYLIEVSAGKQKEKYDYEKSSLSMAVKRDVGGHAVFVADAWTGKPVEKCEMHLYDRKDKLLAEAKAVTLHGFTYLPKEMEKGIKAWDSYLVCSFTDGTGRFQRSRKHYFNEYSLRTSPHTDIWNAVIIQDRAAFNPGESVHFKSIIYHGDPKRELKTAEEGTEVTVTLYDPQQKSVESQTFKTNAFGSVAGQFQLPADRRKGIYRIKLTKNNRELASSSIQVDEYVLPSFTLNFDRQEKFYLPGDELHFSGIMKSYSGHSLSGADIRYSVSVEDKILSEGKLELKSGGKFHITTPRTKIENLYWTRYATVRITATDATGETLEWANSIPISKDIALNCAVKNENDGQVMPIKDEKITYGTKIITEDRLLVAINCLKHDGLNIDYTVRQGKVMIAHGKAQAGEQLEIDLGGKPSGLYHVEVEASVKDTAGELIEKQNIIQIVKISESDTTFNLPSESIISAVKSDGIAIQFGAGLHDIWACVELIGEGNETYKSELVHIGKGALRTVRYDFDESYTNNLLLKIIYFCDGKCQNWSKDYTNKAKSLILPMSFSRFTDYSGPRKTSHFELTTLPGVECAVSVFDKSTDAIRENIWSTVKLESAAPTMSYLPSLGIDRSTIHYDGEGGIFGRSPKMRTMSVSASPSANSAMVLDESAPIGMPLESDIVAYDSDVPAANAEMQPQETQQEPEIREDFAGTVCFQPFLYSDQDGKLSFDVTAGDKLSTFYVYAYGHDREMKNATLRGEMQISIPVKLSVSEPQHLYSGDRYVIKANLSSNLKTACSGTVSFSLFNGKDYKGTKALATKQITVNIPAEGSVPVEFETMVPDIRELGILLKFSSTTVSDAVFVSVPVSPARQTLTEAHSAILHPGDSEERMEAELRSMFVNVQGEEAEMKLTSLLEMVHEALPELIEPRGKDVLALSEALYARLLTAKIAGEQTGRNAEESAATVISDDELVEKLLKCQNTDGGFGWFESMSSSGIITAQVLKMVGTAAERGLKMLPQDNVIKAVKYLDSCFFSKDNKYRWYCKISMEQYAFIRALFPQIAFSTNKLDRKIYGEFRKSLPKYLVPKKARGLNTYILPKARRLRTLMLLGDSEEGLSLAKAFGIRFMTSKRISKSIKADLSSLLEYAVEHKSGGIYYPNAVMPLRGLLESELEAHSLLCDLMRDCRTEGLLSDEKVADGIRLWLMIQKETQQWQKDPSYVEAIGSVLDGSDYVLQTKVMILSKTYTVPFELIQKSGNGMTVSRSFALIGNDGGRTQIKDGDILHIGDKVEARYDIWSEENRSFVHLNVGRPASFRPVNQLSGSYEWWLPQLRINDFYTFTPQGYREVRINGSDYWFDAYPEEKTSISEQFFVTQEGSFQMPVAEIECLYAPHYRGNDSCHHNPMTSGGIRK